ncbi:MAG TPA: peptidase M64 [Caldithrix abyssi]|uniref:Peptidase M64 n=1 Tax=Caldithrix abyssi TaxID=187145 RepID=A0A7V5LJ04_CALAY|nr:peptidase M64 [Caldithrix abyssi]
MFKKFVLLFLLIPLFLSAQVNFRQFFADSTLRIDYYHIGDAAQEMITIDQYYLQPYWSGSLQHLIDPFDNGKYYIQVFDSVTKQVIFSRGFNSYFGEYQTTSQAKKGIKRTYHESALIPFPKVPVVFRLFARDRQNKLNLIFEQTIDLQKIQISKENRAAGAIVFKSHYSGDPHKKADIVFLSEGYTVKDSLKFKNDLQRYTRVLLNKEPFKSYQGKINIYGVFKPSAESFCDEPTHEKFRNTLLNCTFNSMGSYRYLLTEDNRTMQDLASAVPHDAIIIMVNQQRYGGGGIYNFYMDFTTDNLYSENVFIHEFGHSFAGLADEYYASSTAYDEFYPPGVEPTEPNITRLLDPQNLKWKKLVEPGTPIPTPWRKQEFDQLQIDYQKKRQRLNQEIAELNKTKADSALLAAKKKEADDLAKAFNKKVDEILHKDQYSGKVGAFEGAGYLSTGMYRPMLDCVMFRNGDKPFCQVCAQRIREVIEFLSE